MMPRKRGRPPVNRDTDYDTESAPPSKRTTTETTLIFQCIKCLRLLGDSWSYVDTHRSLGYVILSETTENVRARPGFMTSHEEEAEDAGATFGLLECCGCGEVVGRRYRTTPRELDGLRDAYSLGVDRIMTYQIGSNKTGMEAAQPETSEQQQTMEAPPAPDNRLERTRFLVVHLSKRLDAFEERLTETQQAVQALQPPKEEEAEESHDNEAIL